MRSTQLLKFLGDHGQIVSVRLIQLSAYFDQHINPTVFGDNTDGTIDISR